VGLRILSIMRGRCGSGPLLDCKCAADPLKHDGRLPGRASLSLPVCGRQKTRGPRFSGPLVVLSRRRSLLTLRGVRSLWVPKIEFPAPTRSGSGRVPHARAGSTAAPRAGACPASRAGARRPSADPYAVLGQSEAMKSQCRAPRLRRDLPTCKEERKELE
jgi:hypothetical protein